MTTAVAHLRCVPVRVVGLLTVVIACQPSDRELVYVTSGFTDEVIILDGATGAERDRIAVNPRAHETDEPHGITVAPDGHHWYLTLSHGAPTLWKFERPDDRLVGRVSLNTRGASRIGITPDGALAFVPDYDRGRAAEGEVVIVRLHDLAILTRRTVCRAPHDAQVDPEGEVVAITCSLGDEIVLLDARTFAKIARISVDSTPGMPGSPRFKPLNLLWHEDGRTLYVAMHLAREVRAFGLDGSIIGSAQVGDGPAQLAWLSDGRFVVANRMDGSLSVLATEPVREIDRIQLGVTHPHGVAVGPRSRLVYVSFEGDVASSGGVVAVDVDRKEVMWRTDAGAFDLGIMVVRAGTEGTERRYH